jgi:hypothetical protein
MPALPQAGTPGSRVSHVWPDCGLLCPIIEAQIEEYWQLGCKVLNLPGNDVSTWLDGLKARAGRAHPRLKSIGVPMP